MNKWKDITVKRCSQRINDGEEKKGNGVGFVGEGEREEMTHWI